MDWKTSRKYEKIRCKLTIKNIKVIFSYDIRFKLQNEMREKNGIMSHNDKCVILHEQICNVYIVIKEALLYILTKMEGRTTINRSRMFEEIRRF